MVPAAFVPLTVLPLTPNGKVDRQTLPTPVFSSQTPCETEPAHQQAPGTPLERSLVGLWTEILGTAHLGIRDNFFESGGDSLLGLRMVNRLRKMLGENISLVAVFDAPTVSALAGLLQARYPAAVARLSPPDLTGQPVPTSSSLPVSRPLPGIVAVSRESRRVSRSSLTTE